MDNASSSTTPQSSSSTASPSSGRGSGRGRGRGRGATTISLADSSAPPSEPPRGRGRGKSRGGLGKYLRARGRGRGSGRPAEFHERLLLDGDKIKQIEEEDDEEQRERPQKYSRRKLGTNTDRYKEEEPELDSDGEPSLPPEIDLSSFLERQLNVDVDAPILKTVDIDEDDVDHTLAHISSRGIANPNHGKGKIEEIEWDDDMDEMTREKAVADANRELTARFRAKSEKLKKKPIAPTARERKQASYVAAPALPTEQVRNQKDEMQDFLDDLLT
ncbi:hypothetical protein BDZ89DRAFT_283334 [Hymenopellis radicata]|nr:hypothetical protein BDZ89DRAFT_283334 [Hymenopellis radicata]